MWCRICHEHDCEIDHDPGRVIKPRQRVRVSKADKKAMLKKTAEVSYNAVIRQRLNKKPKSKIGMAIKPSHTQLKLF